MRAAKRARKKKKLYVVNPGDDKPHRTGMIANDGIFFVHLLPLLLSSLISTHS